MNYVDGYVLPVKKDRIEEYRKMAEEAGKVWMKYGALSVHECVADDVEPGKVTSFPQSVKLEDDEVVVFAWIVYKSREHRDEVNAKVHEDPWMKDFNHETMPLDGKRMFWGGFKEIVSFESEGA